MRSVLEKLRLDPSASGELISELLFSVCTLLNDATRDTHLLHYNPYTFTSKRYTHVKSYSIDDTNVTVELGNREDERDTQVMSIPVQLVVLFRCGEFEMIEDVVQQVSDINRNEEGQI